MLHQQFILTSTSPSQREFKLIMYCPKCLDTIDTIWIHILFKKLIFYLLIWFLLSKLYLYYNRLCFTQEQTLATTVSEILFPTYLQTLDWKPAYSRDFYPKEIGYSNSRQSVKRRWKKQTCISSEKQAKQFLFLKKIWLM